MTDASRLAQRPAARHSGAMGVARQGGLWPPGLKPGGKASEMRAVAAQKAAPWRSILNTVVINTLASSF